MLVVTIIDHQNNSGSYTYVVPGYSNAHSSTNVSCNDLGDNVNCTGITRSEGTSTPALIRSYKVTGATLSLQLPDGRVAVVNCESKLNWTEWKLNQVYRSCRVPLVNGVHAQFDSDKAKIFWSVSIDGKKMESETYKIVAVLDKP